MENDKYELSKILLFNLDDPKYETTGENLLWIQHFITLSNTLLKNLQINLKELFSNRLETKDVPFLVKFISKTYFDQAIFLEIYNHDILLFFIKYTLYVLLDKIFMVKYAKEQIHTLCFNYIASLQKCKKKSFFERLHFYYNELIKSITEPL